MFDKDRRYSILTAITYYRKAIRLAPVWIEELITVDFIVALF